MLVGNAALCRNTNLQNMEVAKETWTDGRKYTRTLVQPNGEQLSLIAGYVEEVGCHSRQSHFAQTCVAKLREPLCPDHERRFAPWWVSL